MATTLYFRALDNLIAADIADVTLGTDNLTLVGAGSGWDSAALATTRGGTLRSPATATVTGPTAGIEVIDPGDVTPYEWISPPVSADVTISGTITANLWGLESSMNANVALNVNIEILRANTTTTRNSNTIVLIVKSTNTTELGTAASANNFTSGMTSGAYTGQTLNRGDRLRIRVFGDDSAAANMASGFTFTFGHGGPTAAANGDSFVTFTETFAFDGPLTQSDNTATGSILGPGIGANEQQAQPFTAQGNLIQVKPWLRKNNSPTDNLVLEIQTDSAGSPSGSVAGTVATVSNASLTTTLTEYTYSSSITLTPSTTYWLVLRRDGAGDGTNSYSMGKSAGAVGGWTVLKTYNGTSWSAGTQVFAISLTFGGTQLFLTDTASDVATASVDREAWTSRGAGVQTDVTNTAAGWTAPIQVTDTAAGTVVDWFTKQLTAFTLTGLAVANLRANVSSLVADACVRCQISRVDSNGTNPTVWADWCIAPVIAGGNFESSRIQTTEAARTVNVSGDDLAISNGQRLRIRIYTDDSGFLAMGVSQTVTFFYAGTSGGSSGDSYVTLPQSVTEFVSGTIDDKLLAVLQAVNRSSVW